MGKKKRWPELTPEMKKALDAGYRASKTLGTALRRASDQTSSEVLNELYEVNLHVEQALFDIEDVSAVEGSICKSITDCNAFFDSCRDSLPTVDDRYAMMLNDSIYEMENAVEGLKLLVDGYHSFNEDDI